MNLKGLRFLEDVTSEDHVRGYVFALASEERYIAERFLFHQHFFEAEAQISAPLLVKAYLTHLGYNPEARNQLTQGFRKDHLGELDLDVAYSILESAFRWDLARSEELVTEDEAHVFVHRVREVTEEWAVLAFTNLEDPLQHEGDLMNCDFHRVVTDTENEGGVVLVGEQEIAMIWFQDDDGPARGMCDRGYRVSNAASRREAQSTSSTSGRCRVCGLKQAPAPWGEDGKTPTFGICDCCGVVFGRGDRTPADARSYRKLWLAAGAKWFKGPNYFLPKKTPGGWDLEAQLSKVPRAFRDPSGNDPPDHR